MGGTSYAILESMNEVIIDGCSLSISAVVAVARHKFPVRLDPDAELRMQASREVVELTVKKKQV